MADREPRRTEGDGDPAATAHAEEDAGTRLHRMSRRVSILTVLACALAAGWITFVGYRHDLFSPAERVLVPIGIVALIAAAVSFAVLRRPAVQICARIFKLMIGVLLLLLLIDGLFVPTSNMALHLAWFPAYYAALFFTSNLRTSTRDALLFFGCNAVLCAWAIGFGPLAYDHPHMLLLQLSLTGQIVVLAIFYYVSKHRGAYVAQRERARALEERAAEMREEAARALEARRLAETANRAKSQFLATMSHELRTPLNAIIGFSEILQSEDAYPGLADKRGEYLVDIHHSAVHLLDIINDILDVARIESGKVNLAEEPVAPRRVIDAVLTLAGPKAHERGVTLAVEQPDEAIGLYGDQRLVKQILINLVSNAVKFTDRGGQVTIRAEIDDEGQFRLSVSDTGIGIDPAHVGKVTQPFYQAENPYARSYEGTGLGLSLVKSFVDLHKGRLEIQSALGKGTTVCAIFSPDRSLRHDDDLDDWVAAVA